MAMAMGDDAVAMAYGSGGDCPNRGKAESSKSDSSKVELV